MSCARSVWCAVWWRACVCVCRRDHVEARDRHDPLVVRSRVWWV